MVANKIYGTNVYATCMYGRVMKENHSRTLQSLVRPSCGCCSASIGNMADSVGHNVLVHEGQWQLES